MKRYNPTEIEPKWQQVWADDHRYQAPDASDKPKYYVTGMFPYPSGAGMHTGHFFEHSIVDAEARFRRSLGYNVTYPMGWDSFGLPAENYAIKTGRAPADTTKENIANFKNQLTRVGASIDWSREINTTDPEYYKWTQWIFTQLYARDLAYQKEANQWWCPKDKTVLANEQVINGKCWRCDSVVIKKSMKQWFFKITDYADALLEETPSLDWPNKIKSAQTNWIGRSEGAEINFQVVPSEKPNVVILHGYTGRADKNWLPWIKSDLESKGYDVQAPQMPNTDTPTEIEQVGYVLKNCTFNESTVLIGHSLGCAVAMKVLQKLDHPIRQLVLVAPVVEPAFRDADYLTKGRTFIDTFDLTYDYSDIMKKAPMRLILSEKAEAPTRRPYLEYLSHQIEAPLYEATGERIHFTGETEPFILRNLYDSITVFSTRPDTLFGATFLVLAPEHPLARELANDNTRDTVNDYIDNAIKKSEIERSSEGKDKTGVFTGSYATNPISGEKIPIWVADYVLWGYGTGAVMGVPAHDERDFVFAEKFRLSIVQVVAPFKVYDGDKTPREDMPTVYRPTIDAIITDGNGKYLLQIEDEKNVHFVGGGIDEEDESTEAAVRREVLEEVGFTNIISIRQAGPFTSGVAYRNGKNRNQHTWGAYYEVVVDPSVQVESEIEEGRHSVEWVDKGEVASRITWEFHKEGWSYYLKDQVVPRGVSEGTMVNSGEFDGKSSSDAREEIVAWLEAEGKGRSKVTYKMRDWLISRQRYWGAPIPIIHCPDHGAVAVPEKDLPVLLPVVEDFIPKGDGKSPLARQTDWVNTVCPTCGKPAVRETDVMDGYACSSWYLLRYTDPHNAEQAWAPEKAAYWTPIDMYVGGDHAVAHLLYVRFWNHVFYDMGLVPGKEPVKKLVYHGLIQAEDGRKMSKSLGNVVDPLEVIDAGYGADALRTFELFLGPINENSSWSSKGIAGVYRFINRVWTLTQEYMESDKAGTVDARQLTSASHATIKKVTGDMYRLSFNTAVAALMEHVNELYKLKATGFTSDWQEPLEALIQLLQPIAPHVAAELWQQLGHDDALDTVSWPEWDDAKIVTDVMTIIVQVNGKLRAKLEVAPGATEESIRAAALADENVQRHLSGEPKKVIYIAGKLVSIVA